MLRKKLYSLQYDKCNAILQKLQAERLGMIHNLKGVNFDEHRANSNF